MQPELLLAKIRETAGTGVDIVKIGLFASPDKLDCIKTIGKHLAREVKMIAVIFAEDTLDVSMLKSIKQSGFYGVMLDTSIKNGKTLLDHVSLKQLELFVVEAKSEMLFVGLAGSLRLQDVELLTTLEADYLGFRGALCAQDVRQSSLSVEKLKLLSNLLHKNNKLLQKREVSI